MPVVPIVLASTAAIVLGSLLGPVPDPEATERFFPTRKGGQDATDHVGPAGP
jgi:hypothetical protein